MQWPTGLKFYYVIADTKVGEKQNPLNAILFKL